MTTAPTDNWLPQESIALVDNAPLFSAGDGDHAVTFWQILVDSTPELSARSALECEEHWLRRIELEPIRDVVLRVGPAPPVLEDWTRLDDGRYVGRLSGQPSAVWLTVAKEGRLEIDPRSTPGYIETTEGRIYELAVSTRTAGAESQRLQPEERPATPFVVRFPRSPQELVGTQGLVIALSLLALGFGMGVADKDRALEQLSLSPTATEMVVPKSDGTASLEAELAAIQASRKAAEAELKAAKQAAAVAQKQAAAVTKRAEPKAATAPKAAAAPKAATAEAPSTGKEASRKVAAEKAAAEKESRAEKAAVKAAADQQKVAAAASAQAQKATANLHPHPLPSLTLALAPAPALTLTLASAQAQKAP